jgi:hypothetical protein
MSETPNRRALFEGLVFSEEGEPVSIDQVGGQPFYVVPDADFRRYVEAETIDRQVLEWLYEQILSNQEAVTEGMMSMLGQEDLFTKAMIDASIQDMDQQMERLMASGLPEGVQAWLGMLGFRIVVNLHGEVLEIDAPSAVDEGEL